MHYKFFGTVIFLIIYFVALPLSFCLAVPLASSQIIAANKDPLRTSSAPQPSGLRLYPVVYYERILEAFLGVPYAIDGAIDQKGKYTYFARPKVLQPNKGLNCSGFVLAAAGALLDKNISLPEAIRDRQKDSASDSIYGEDWDFGWDLLLNISDGHSRRVLLPEGRTATVEDIDIHTPQGFAIQSESTWQELPKRLKQNHLYLVSFNKESHKKRYKLQHYHVGIIFIDLDGNMWMYQTTGESKKVYRRNLSNPTERAAFLRSFADNGKIRKHMLILEVEGLRD